MNLLSFVENKLVLTLTDSKQASIIDLKDVYFIQVEPLKNATSHYRVQMVLEHKDKLSNKIIKEKYDGGFIQYVEIYTMIDKIDTTKIDHSSFILIDKSVDDTSNNSNHFQLLNLDCTNGFEIRHAQKEHYGIEETFYEVSYYKRGYFDVDSDQVSEIEVSIVFNYLYEHYIEVNIPKLVNYVKNKRENPNNVISFNVNETMKFLKDKQLDTGFMSVKRTFE